MKMVDKSSKLDKFSANIGGGGSGVGGSGIGGVGGAGSSGGNSGVMTSTSNYGAAAASGVGSQNIQKPVPMKLFAAWEVDRTPPNCIPR
ncbi:PREDICTED: protein PopA1-like [Rhagoletis zephyria]|nr:PREDICTED: protein PopA1-like [Rhagoletis zephyria]